MPPLTKLFINGEYRPSSSEPPTFEVLNPFSHQVVGLCSTASSRDCHDAIEAANKAFASWENTTPWQRRDVLLKAADHISTEKYKRALITGQREETAATDGWGYGQWVVAQNFLRTTASMANELKGESFVSGSVAGAQVVTQRRALGVILAIAPWNAALTLTLRTIAVPILCGNTIVFKCSELSPRSQAIVADLFAEAGLPPGVLNIMSISRETAPELTAEIIAHLMVRKVAFTGSERVGRILAMEAAKFLKPCVLELGGKAPVVVLSDANIREAARSIVFGAMAHSGQVCMSAERVIVHQDVAEQLVGEVKRLCEGIKAGDPSNSSDPSVKLGALFSEASARNVVSMMQEAVDGGARLVLGDLKHEGSVVQPHLLADVDVGMRLWKEESFGPVTVFMSVNTIDDAVEMANATTYSLSTALWTTDVHSAVAVAPCIRAGVTSVNGPTFHSEAYVGVIGLGGSSGYGRFDVENFTDKRSIISHPDWERPYPGLL
ncbi:aldehyde dehydrogenase [Pleurotus eryngii]|uniref:Aldehyde dehydrogenase n=1 Tax=Pleurotus eryngii TaxID=5323 RepID=A0A9P6DAG8_PLEER|nr:aldehyde dehydrogenase [Pleurotus eryngii]